MIYLDWAATALPDSDVFARSRAEEFRHFGNPSSIHTQGREARHVMETARSSIARLLSCRDEEFIFTSGGTEANNMILFSLLRRDKKPGSDRRRRIVVSSIEHPSVYEPAMRLRDFGFDVVFVHPEESGIINVNKLYESLDKETILVSVMFVNNETGAIQPLAEISKAISDFSEKNGRQIIFHVDAVQGFGKLRFYPHGLELDAASVSGHKLGAPKGVGGIFVRKGTHPDFLYRGGDQEFANRPGTENPGTCLALSLAAEKRIAEMAPQTGTSAALINILGQGIKTIKGSAILPQCRNFDSDYDERFSPYILKAAFPPVPGEVLVRVLDENGISVSTGAACSSRKQKEKHRVLVNSGISREIAESSIRISTGFATTENDIRRCLEVLEKEIPQLMKLSGLKSR